METDPANPPAAPRVCVVTINWNGLADTLDCLESLQSDRYSNKEIVVIDNGSADDSVARIRDRFPQVTVLEARMNLGFSGGNNLGLRHATTVGADYIYWLNNDTTSQSDAIAKLVAAAEAEPQFGIMTPLIDYFDQPGGSWFAGSTIDLSRGEALHDNTHRTALNGVTRDIPWASGCALFASRSLMEQLGGFDERFFLNWEDVDLCRRVVAGGRLIGLVAAAKIHHKVSRSFASGGGVGTYYHVRNNLLFSSLHRPARHHHWTTLRIAARHLRSGLRGIIRRDPNAWRNMRFISRALADYLCGRFGKMSEPLKKA